ncbi:MAG: TPM domain-containing protein [Cytophagaceae bacterium]|nr:TPM domain-containing protein [Cytophagaceae bacterium]
MPPTRSLLRVLGHLTFVLFLTTAALAQELPPKPDPPRLVNDFVGILSGSERQQLEQKLLAFNDSTSTQITIVIVKSTGDYPPGDYAFALGRAWGVGQKGKNNGVILLWATGDRKIFIAPGYGLEGALPDAICKRIISNILGPNFKQEQYFAGLDAATDEIIRRASGEFEAEPKDTAKDEGFPSGLLIFIVIIVIIFIFLAGRNRGGGKGLGRGGGMFIPPFTTFTGWGSSSGGSGWGGGSSGGGGFGGFGGGSFGGGGAGGDY